MFTEISLLSSYLKTAIRNLARHRIYSVINIIGMCHRPRLLHPHLSLRSQRMDLRHLSRKRRPHLSGLYKGET